MRPAHATAPAHGLRPRLPTALLAFTVTATLLGSLLLAFEASAPDLWLTPTPEILEMVADCERQPERHARDDCKQDVVASHLARERGPVHLARR